MPGGFHPVNLELTGKNLPNYQVQELIYHYRLANLPHSCQYVDYSTTTYPTSAQLTIGKAIRPAGFSTTSNLFPYDTQSPYDNTTHLSFAEINPI